MLSSLPVLLAAIYFFVPVPIQEQIAVDHQNVRLYALFTAAYVHASTGHLVVNITGYAVAVSYAYWLCLQMDRRRWFWATTALLLIVVPVVTNAATAVLFGTYLPEVSGLSRGFSGVVGAFGGFLFVAFVIAVRDAYDGNLAQLVGVSLFLLLLVMVDLVYAGVVRPVVAAVVAVGIGVQITGYIYDRDRGFPHHRVASREDIVQLAGGLLVVAVLASLIYALFPSEFVQGGGFMNIFAHGIGFMIGGLIPAFLLSFVDTT